MTLSGIGAASKILFTLGPPLLFCPRLARRWSSFGVLVALPEQAFLDGHAQRDQASSSVSTSSYGVEGLKVLPWKVMSSKVLGIKKSMIAKQTRSAINELRRRGYEVYLVGGCVRDLIMRRVPKDFDILTTANLLEVKKAFSRCDIVGKRFPICHVYIDDYIVEVSSFSTPGSNSSSYVKYISRTPPDCEEIDCMRWRNCLGRDFTINGLMFDPYSQLIYDYLGGMEDIKKAKVRTVIPARISFQEDCARILRAIRIAARLEFHFTRETAQCIKELAALVLTLDKGRILMEMNYMLSYGSAEASLRLLWKFGLLELLLPIQAAYFVSQGFWRRDTGNNMLLALLSNLDILLAPDRPCHNSLWIGVKIFQIPVDDSWLKIRTDRDPRIAVLAFHEALVCIPRDPLVVATFGLCVHNGGDMLKASHIARRITNQHNQNVSELLEPRVWDEDNGLINEVVDLASSVISALWSMTDERFVFQAMARYPQAPMSDLVFIPLHLSLRVLRIFECVIHRDRESGFVPKQGRKINYYRLANGDLAELRHVFARVVFDTIYPPKIEEQNQNSTLAVGS